MDLSSLPTHKGFRLRGQSVSRLETFVDAAFAFSITLVVISVGSLPTTVPELLAALHRVPTFLFCFGILATFWAGHNRWSRRYGIEDGRVTFISLAFVFVTLIYVYPLRMVSSGALAFVTQGWVPPELRLDSASDLQDCFLVYGIGFVALSLLLFLLHRHALGHAREIELDAVEELETRREAWEWMSFAGAGTLSIALTFCVRDAQSGWLASMPGWAYGSIGIAIGFQETHFDRARAALHARART